MPGDEGTAAGGAPFPELLAGLVAAPAGIETLLKAAPATQRGEVASSAGAATPAAKRLPHGKLAGERTGSSRQAGETSEFGVPVVKTPEPDPEPPAARQTLSAVQMQLSGQTSLAPTVGVANQKDGQAATAVGKVEAEVFSEPLASPETARGEQPPNAWMAVPARMGPPPAEPEVDGESANHRQAVPAVSQPCAERPIEPRNAPAVDVALAHRPAGAPTTSRQTTRPSAQTAIVVTETPVGTKACPVAAVPVLDEGTARRQVGGAGGSPVKAPPAAIVRRTEDPSPDREEQGQATKMPALARNPAGINAKPDAGSAAGTMAAPASPRPASAESVPLQPGTQTEASRPRPEHPDVAITAGEITVRGAAPAPVDPPLASTDATASSAPRATRTQASAPSSRKSSGSVVAQVLALSGLMPRTVDSISPAGPAPRPVKAADGAEPPLEQRAAAEPAKVQPQSLAESLVPTRDPQVRVLAASSPDSDEVAFAVQMKAMAAPEDTVQRESPVSLAAAEGSRRISVPAPPGNVAGPEPSTAASEKHQSLPVEPDPAPARAGRERRPDVASFERSETSAAAAGKTIPQAAQGMPAAGETPDAAAAKPVRPQDALDSEPRPEAPKSTPVRDMKLEVTGGDQRVEVRLSERAGEVKMTVRTADAPLASTLRENLPALNARLAESGFKSEAWRPAAFSTSELRHTAESSARGASQDANAQPRGQDREPQNGAGQRRPKSPQQPIPQKEKGRDFAWLMSSLR